MNPESVPWWRTQGTMRGIYTSIISATLIVTETLLQIYVVGVGGDGGGLTDIAPSPLFHWAGTECRPLCSMCAKPIAVHITMHVPVHDDWPR